jgi:hypothetical protein
MWPNGMWFATKSFGCWIPMPKIDSNMSKVGWSNRADFLNGGVSIARSTAAHKEYELSWNLQSRDNLRPITDFADGIYGSGPYYFIDPFAADKNILPQAWASPMIGGLDGPTLVQGVRPTNTSVTAENGYPVMQASYTIGSTSVSKQLYIPIPTGYTFWLGVHGSATGASKVYATPVTNGSLGTSVAATFLTRATSTRVNTSIPSTSGAGVLIEIIGLGTISLSGMIGQILPTGITPSTGGFISGQGHSGCEFEAQPQLQNYSVGLDLSGISVKMIEVGSWL